MSGLDVTAVRADIPALNRLLYLNTGTVGPLPAPVRDAMVGALDLDVAKGRASGRRFARAAERLDETRHLLAGLVGAQPEQLALTSGTTDGIERVLSTQPWQPGDRVLTTALEHPDVLTTIRHTADRHALTAVVVNADTAEDLTANLARELAAGARLVVVSHVTFGAGLVLPLSKVIAAAHAQGARVLVDGAQAVGAIEIDTLALGADFYAFPLQKWLLGPEGAGGLVVRDGAREIHSATPPAIWEGVRAALLWRKGHGHQRFSEAVRENAARLRELLVGLPGVEVVTPGDQAGLVAVHVSGTDPLEVAKALGRQRIATRGITEIGAVRLSAGPFLTGGELEQVACAVGNLASEKGVLTW
ncbi:aminotransferase class V-fold PLP-dependent enzyme [Amycolatopsis panacis]|uniref:Aminotransferase class V-fold PLP-dependent enzyme n=1 Tax=Amycolatopsis panacis TaxID=2340917 RepID=A0A419I292_9PSEU|nr:aminotransferase class V-fold PLP-dependent enzyme [Amycolatopsis panacis]RJQ83983.1 aminotransferase class V-fold PLP-dependent enzyme [Amycolatopsis panacis]